MSHKVMLPGEPVGSSLEERDPEAVVTLVIPTRRKQSIPPDLWYPFWTEAHSGLLARAPGPNSAWLNSVTYEEGSAWPQVPGVDEFLPPDERFDAAPEATFVSFEDLQQFQGLSEPQLADGPSFLEETIVYASQGRNSRSFVDKLEDPAPNGDDHVLRYMVFLRKRDDVELDAFRGFMSDELSPSLAESPLVQKLRLHLPEPYSTEEATIDHEGVRMDKAPEKQYQGILDVVVRDPLALAELAQSDAWTSTVAGQQSHVKAAHPFRVHATYTSRYNGRLTLAALRTPAVADLIKRVGAANHLRPEVVELFLSGFANVEQPVSA